MDVATSSRHAAAAGTFAFAVACGVAAVSGCSSKSSSSSFGGQPAATVVTLASASLDVMDLTVDEHRVYYTGYDGTGDGVVLALGVDGGTPTTLATAQAYPSNIAVDPSSVYWIDSDVGDGGAVVKVGLGGGTPTTLAEGQPQTGGLAVAGGTVYFTTGSCFSTTACTANVESVPAKGGAVSTLASGAGGSLAVDATNVYVATGSGKVMKVPRGGGAPTTLWFEQANDDSVTVDSTSVYWTNSIGDVMKIPLGGGHPTALDFESLSGSPLAVDARGVYFAAYGPQDSTNTTWDLERAGFDGGAPVTLATSFAGPIVAIASDGANLYVATAAGVIAKVTPTQE